jgi:hypothetical protein
MTGEPQFTRRTYLRLLAGQVMHSPLLLGLTAVAAGMSIGLLISVVIR